MAPFTIASSCLRGTRGAGADGDGMDGGGRQLRQHLGIGRPCQFALLLCQPEAGRERLVEFVKPLQHHGADFRIGHRFRCRRHHREAAARAGVAGQIDIERHGEDALQPFPDRQFVPENIDHRRAGVVAIALVALDVEFALVAECTIEARPVHAGGRAEIVERGSGETVLAKQIERLRQCDLGLIGARPSAPLRLRGGISFCRWPRPFVFLYHFAKNSLTRIILCGTV